MTEVWACEIAEGSNREWFAALASASDGGVAQFCNTWRIDRGQVDTWICNDCVPHWAMIAVLASYVGLPDWPDGDLSAVLADGKGVVSSTIARREME